MFKNVLKYSLLTWLHIIVDETFSLIMANKSQLNSFIHTLWCKRPLTDFPTDFYSFLSRSFQISNYFENVVLSLYFYGIFILWKLSRILKAVSQKTEMNQKVIMHLTTLSIDRVQTWNQVHILLDPLNKYMAILAI